MTRKVFWILWVTIWPAVAIIPPLISAQAPTPEQSEAANRLEDFPDDQLLESSIAEDGSVQLESPLPKPPAPALRVVPQLEFSEQLPTESEPSLTVLETPEVAKPARGKAGRTVTSEEPVRSTPAGQVPEALPPSTTPRSSSSSIRVPHNQPIAPRLTRSRNPEFEAQEEQAQKLIHERAVTRGVQRQQRLEAKTRNRQVVPSAAQTTRWQPHLTQTNWAVGRHTTAHP